MLQMCIGQVHCLCFPFSDQRFFCVSLLPGFGVRVSVTFHLTCVHIIFSSVWVAEWPPFGKKLLTRLTICSLCIALVAPVHGLCTLFTSCNMLEGYGDACSRLEP